MTSIVNKIKDKVASHSTSPGEHLALIIPTKGSRLQLVHRHTPTPGPNELLIEVKSIALNPIDHYQRDFGFHINDYPAIPGSDVGGIVVAAGSAVPSDAPQPGTRVSAYAPCFFEFGRPDYGAFQARVLVPAVNVAPLPQSMTFNEASLLPMAVMTAWRGYYHLGIPLSMTYRAPEKTGMLVWGGASSVGSAALQVAKLLGFTVYTTASTTHHEYLKTLGASRTFDYKSANVVESIIKTAKEDGIAFNLCYDAVPGTWQPCLDVLTALKGDRAATLASAVPLSADTPNAEGVEVKFIASATEEDDTRAFFNFVFRTWLTDKLAKGEFLPSPKIRVEDGGLEGVNKALDVFKEGVSGTKLVLEL